MNAVRICSGARAQDPPNSNNIILQPKVFVRKNGDGRRRRDLHNNYAPKRVTIVTIHNIILHLMRTLTDENDELYVYLREYYDSTLRLCFK